MKGEGTPGRQSGAPDAGKVGLFAAGLLAAFLLASLLVMRTAELPSRLDRLSPESNILAPLVMLAAPMGEPIPAAIPVSGDSPTVSPWIGPMDLPRLMDLSRLVRDNNVASVALVCHVDAALFKGHPDEDPPPLDPKTIQLCLSPASPPMGNLPRCTDLSGRILLARFFGAGAALTLDQWRKGCLEQLELER